MEHIQHISGTLQEHLQNTYGIFMAMLNKIINHFYTILDNFNQRLIFVPSFHNLGGVSVLNLSTFSFPIHFK